MKKGFTLVELLAVLAILSIITIIGGVSVFGIIGNIRKQSLEDGLKNLQEASITYVQDKRLYLSSCTQDFDPQNPIANPLNNTCYKEITLKNILDEELFDVGDLKCHESKKIIVYRIQVDNYSELKSYLSENICEL